MSDLMQRLQADATGALKRRDGLALQALRLVISQAKNLRIERGRELTDADVMSVLQKAIKTRRESVEQFRKGQREDLASKEEGEIALLEGYLPRPLTEAELTILVEEVVREVGASGKKDLGRVMKEIQARAPGRVDNRLASRIASEKLA